MHDSRRLALGISASGPLSCALLSEGRVLTSDTPTNQRSAGKLAAIVANLLQQAGAEPERIVEVRVDIGPGSYTGLRAALAFAQIAGGFAGTTLLTATSAELVVVAALENGVVNADDCLLSLRDGTRKLALRTELQVSEHVTISDSPRALGYDELCESIRPEHVLLADTGLNSALRARLAKLGCKLLTPPVYGAAQLFSSRLNLLSTPAGDLEPLYLMGSYAE